MKIDGWQAALVFLAGFACGWLVRRGSQRTRQASALTEARTDVLTGLANRRDFDNKLTEWLATGKALPAGWVLAMIDIDRFKEINDTFGHLAGDEVLRRTATLFRECFSDAILIARYGGEEFAVILPGPLARAAEAVESLRQRMASQPIECAGAGVRITISAGLCEATAGATAKLLLCDADRALYAAKQGGRDRVHAWVGGAAVPWNQAGRVEPT